MIATQEPFAPKARRDFFFKNSIPKQSLESANSLCKTFENIHFFGFRQNFRKMAARNLTGGARAAVYRGAAVLCGAKDGEARNRILGARAAVYRGAAVLLLGILAQD